MGKDLDWTPPIGPRDEKSYREMVYKLAKEAVACEVDIEAFLSQIKEDFPDFYDGVREKINELKKYGDPLDVLESKLTY